jgi:hypothetical protein
MKARLRVKWTAAAIERFGVGDMTPCDVEAFRGHCGALHLAVPSGLRGGNGQRLECDLPDTTGWVGTAPRIVEGVDGSLRWILAD